MLAASQTRDKESLTVDGVERVLSDLSKSFDYVVLDSPAGIESGAKHAMYFADDTIIVTNPELSSCRDADKMVGFVWSKSRRAELGPDEAKPVTQTLLINRYDPERVSEVWVFDNVNQTSFLIFFLFLVWNRLKQRNPYRLLIWKSCWGFLSLA
jgi:septum formation inhibitor-activating ATPase MinD